jgi:hypothetical protein
MNFITNLFKPFINFPLYDDDGDPLYIANPATKEAIIAVNKKIKRGEYQHKLNPCLCGNKFPNQDTLISKKDMWGLSVENVICSKCGLIRSKEILNDESMTDFYEKYYKTIYYGTTKPDESHFAAQKSRGQGFFDLLQSLGLADNINIVFDYGCDMGGALVPFADAGKIVSGCSFGKDFVSFGRSKGLTGIYHGELDQSETKDSSQDLVILSHVMEHFPHPIIQMERILSIIKPEKYLLVEVPGIFADNPYKYYPIWHIQKGHVFNFYYKDFLILFFNILGLKVLFCNERCTFIMQKPKDYQFPSKTEPIYSPELEKYPRKVTDIFIDRYIKYDFLKFLNPYRASKFASNIVDLLRIREGLKFIFKRSRN